MTVSIVSSILYPPVSKSKYICQYTTDIHLKSRLEDDCIPCILYTVSPYIQVLVYLSVYHRYLPKIFDLKMHVSQISLYPVSCILYPPVCPCISVSVSYLGLVNPHYNIFYGSPHIRVQNHFQAGKFLVTDQFDLFIIPKPSWKHYKLF